MLRLIRLDVDIPMPMSQSWRREQRLSQRIAHWWTPFNCVFLTFVFARFGRNWKVILILTVWRGAVLSCALHVFKHPKFRLVFVELLHTHHTTRHGVAQTHRNEWGLFCWGCTSITRFFFHAKVTKLKHQKQRKITSVYGCFSGSKKDECFPQKDVVSADNDIRGLDGSVLATNEGVYSWLCTLTTPTYMCEAKKRTSVVEKRTHLNSILLKYRRHNECISFFGYYSLLSIRCLVFWSIPQGF